MVFSNTQQRLQACVRQPATDVILPPGENQTGVKQPTHQSQIRTTTTLWVPALRSNGEWMQRFPVSAARARQREGYAWGQSIFLGFFFLHWYVLYFISQVSRRARSVSSPTALCLSLLGRVGLWGNRWCQDRRRIATPSGGLTLGQTACLLVSWFNAHFNWTRFNELASSVVLYFLFCD